MIFGFGMTFANHAYATPHATLDPKLQRRVGEQVDLHAGLEHRIPRHLACAHIVRWIYLETPLLNTHRKAILEDIHVEEYVDYTRTSWHYINFILYHWRPGSENR